MCLYTRWNKPRIAQRDRIVFKVLVPGAGDTWVSPHRFMVYKFGKRHRAKLAYEFGRVDAGLHAFRTLGRAQMYARSGRQVFRARIPKGAKYFTGEDGEIVSNQLIVEKPL